VSGGRRRAERVKPARGSGTVRRSVLLVAGTLAAGVAWVFLVNAAIEFGRVARNGNLVALAVCLAATLGGTVCLLLVFVLCVGLAGRLGLVSGYAPRRSSGRRTR